MAIWHADGRERREQRPAKRNLKAFSSRTSSDRMDGKRQCPQGPGTGRHRIVTVCAASRSTATEAYKLGPVSHLKRAAVIPLGQAVATWECGPNVARSFHFSRRAKAPDYYVKFLDFLTGIKQNSRKPFSAHGPAVWRHPDGLVLGSNASLPTTNWRRHSEWEDRERGQKTSSAAAPTWATISCHGVCRQHSGPSPEAASRPLSMAICLASRYDPAQNARVAAPGLCSDTPTREGPRYHARYLPFDADIGHNSDPHGRGKKPVLYHLLSDRNV